MRFHVFLVAVYLRTVSGLLDGIIQEYGRMKVLADCLGSDFMKGWNQRILESGQQCYHQNSPHENFDFFADYLNPISDGNYQFYRPHSADPKVVYVMSPPVPNYLQFPYQKTRRIWKRSAARTNTEKELLGKNIEPTRKWRSQKTRTDEKQLLQRRPDRIRKIEHQLSHKLSNITCVLQKSGLLDEHYRPNYPFLISTIHSLPVNDVLKSDILHNHDFCREFAMCLPVHRLKSQISRKYGQGFFYMKCMRKSVMKSCMKHDLQHFLRFELGYHYGVPSFLAGRSGDADGSFDPSGLMRNLLQIFDLNEFDIDM